MKKTTERLTPPWMMGAKDINKIPMIVCHFSNGELEGLDNLQGGPSIDPGTGIREYSALSSIIELPEVREIFHKVSNDIDLHGKLSPEMHSAYETAKQHSLPYRETPEEEHNPIHGIEKSGRNGDTKLALIPLNLAEFLIELRHVPSINPETGLLEFWNPIKSAGKALNKFRKSRIGKDVIRTGATIAGAVAGTVIGGPGAGTSIGAGIGKGLGRAATGSNFKKSALSGLKTAAITYGAHGLGQTAGLGANTPHTAGLFGGNNLLAQGLGSMGIGAHKHLPGIRNEIAMENAQGPGSSGSGFEGAGNNLFGGNNQNGPSGGMFSNMSSLVTLAPLLAAGASYMGERSKHKEKKKELQELRDIHKEERKKMGWETDWKPVEHKEQVFNPAYLQMSWEDRKRGRIEPEFIDKDVYEELYGPYEGQTFAKGGLVKSYNKGTLVRGKGKGQQDLIKTTVPDGTYIIDASSTADFGDGSSTAGASVLKELENTIRRRMPKKVVHTVTKEVARKSKQVPVWLSDSEYKIDPVTVTLLGRGSNKHGADILRSMVKNLRKHKISKGDELPPKAKHPFEYMTHGRR